MWRPIDDATPEPGKEVVIRLKSPDASHRDPFWWGRSVHQIARWTEEGELFSHGRHVPPELIQAYFPIPSE